MNYLMMNYLRWGTTALGEKYAAD